MKTSLLRYCLAIGITFFCGLATAKSTTDDFVIHARMNDTNAIIKALNAGHDPNSIDSKGHLAIVAAMTEGSWDVATILINYSKTQINKKNAFGESALMMAAFMGRIDVVKTLINDKKAEFSHPGWTPLHYAATNGHLEILRFLLDKGAYVDPESPNQTTALMMAVRGGHIHVVKELLDRGANLSQMNQLQMTAIDFADQFNQVEIAKGLRSRWLKIYGSPYISTAKPAH